MARRFSRPWPDKIARAFVCRKLHREVVLPFVKRSSKLKKNTQYIRWERFEPKPEPLIQPARAFNSQLAERCELHHPKWNAGPALLQRLWIRRVLWGMLIEQRNHFLRRRRNGDAALANDVGGIHLLMIDALVGVVVRTQRGAFERYACKKTARTRISEHLSAKRHVGFSGRIAAFRPRCRRGVGSELHLAGENCSSAARVHHQNDKVCGLPAELKSEAATFERDHSWRAPLARKVFAGTARHGAASVGAPDSKCGF